MEADIPNRLKAPTTGDCDKELQLSNSFREDQPTEGPDYRGLRQKAWSLRSTAFFRNRLKAPTTGDCDPVAAAFTASHVTFNRLKAPTTGDCDSSSVSQPEAAG